MLQQGTRSIAIDGEMSKIWLSSTHFVKSEYLLNISMRKNRTITVVGSSDSSQNYLQDGTQSVRKYGQTSVVQLTDAILLNIVFAE